MIEWTIDELAQDGELGFAVGFLGLFPDASEVGVAVVEEVGFGDDGVDVGDREAWFDFPLLLETLAVEAGDEVLADQLGEVGLAVGEVVDQVDRVTVVVDREVFGGVGDEAGGGGLGEKGDGDFFDAAEEGVPVVLGHFLEGVESGEGEDDPGEVVEDAAPVADQAGAETTFTDACFD